MVSDEYIRMCKEAIEIQEVWEPKEGDLVFNWKLQEFMKTKNREEYVKPIILDFESLSCVPNPVEFWLPRQEDLIKIMENNWEHGRCEIIGHFHNFSWNYIHDRCEKYDFNELWLMVLMEYVYDKRWDGKGWVKQ